TITVSPNPIPGNLTVTVLTCIEDALQSPIANVHFGFTFANLGVGTASLDGIATNGVVPDGTGADGCVTTTVVTNGLDSGGSPTLTFTAGTASKVVPITVVSGLVLLAKPTVLGGSGGTVILTLLTSNGSPVPGVQLTGSCTGDASIGIVQGPG